MCNVVSMVSGVCCACVMCGVQCVCIGVCVCIMWFGMWCVWYVICSLYVIVEGEISMVRYVCI